MRLDHEFTVPAPIEKVWQAVLDPERVAPCMPGATLSEVDGNVFRGSVKVKLGPVNLLYKGSGEFREKDEHARRLVIRASGKDSRGAGTASATVTVTLTADGPESTHGAVATDLNVTGRPAQFGRGMISDVGGRILDSFAESLAGELGASTSAVGESDRGETAVAGAASGDGTDGIDDTESAGGRHDAHRSESAARDADGAIDLMQYAGSSVAKRAAPVLAGVGAVAVLLVLVRMLRRRRG